MGRESLRRIRKYCEDNIDKLRQYMPLEGGIPSVSTMSRTISGVDLELLYLTFNAWVGSYLDTRGRDIAIDGKGLIAGTRKIRGEQAPYIMNAIDIETKLVVGQYPIMEKTNEAGILPEFLKLMELENSTVTIDAIGTSGRVMETIHEGGGHFVLQVKKNCPVLYQEIMDLFEGLEKEKREDPELFQKTYGEVYSEYNSGLEKNRERKEYRKVQEYHDTDGINAFKEERPYIGCVGKSWQVRIEKIEDAEGNDVTPPMKEFLEKGSKRQQKPKEGDGIKDAVLSVGLVSDLVLSARELAMKKRNHWSIENSLHWVLDNTMGEDRSKIKNGREAASVLRKCAYNIGRILQHGKLKSLKLMVDVFDKIKGDIRLGADQIYKPIIPIV